MVESDLDAKWFGFGMPFDYRKTQPFENRTNGSHFECSVFKWLNHLKPTKRKTGKFAENGHHFAQFSDSQDKRYLFRLFENWTPKCWFSNVFGI